MKKIFFLLFICMASPSYTQVQLHNGASLQMHESSNLSIVGDLTNNGSMVNNLGKLWLIGNSQQSINGSNLIQVNQLELNNTMGFKLDNELQLSDQLIFINGIVTTDIADTTTEFVHFLAASSYTGSSDARHIDGVVKKTGNTSFTFPTGDDGRLMPISISAPANITDEFRAYYRYENAHPSIATWGSGSFDFTIDRVSTKEYWMLDRTNGTSSVQLTLSWNDSSEVEEPFDLVIAHWNGSFWEDKGGVNHSGNSSSGTLMSSGAINSFSPFTLASISAANPLPITLVYFYAKKRASKSVDLIWETASEVNNDYYTIERLNSENNWEAIGTVKGAGNSNSTLRYTFTDFNPAFGENYYRLKQTDYDGTSTHSNVRMVMFEPNADDFQLYPNPAQKHIIIEYPGIQPDYIRLYDQSGRIVKHHTPIISSEMNQLKLNISALSKGVYFLSFSNIQKRIIIQ